MTRRPDLLAQATAGPHPTPAALFTADGAPTMDLSGPGLTGRHHPDHARDDRDHGSQRHQIMEYLEAAGLYGATAAELVEAGAASSVPNAGTRLIELRGETAAHPARLVARLVDRRTGRPVTRRGPSGRSLAVHVATSVLVPADWPHRWQDPPVVRLCPCCGQALKDRQLAAPIIDRTADGMGAPW